MKNFEELLTMLNNNLISRLDLSGEELSISQMRDLTAALTSNTSVKTVNFGSNGLSKEETTLISNMLKENFSISKIEFQYSFWIFDQMTGSDTDIGYRPNLELIASALKKNYKLILNQDHVNFDEKRNLSSRIDSLLCSVGSESSCIQEPFKKMIRLTQKKIYVDAIEAIRKFEQDSIDGMAYKSSNAITAQFLTAQAGAPKLESETCGAGPVVIKSRKFSWLS